MKSHILGVNCFLHDSSAALYRDGELIFAVEEERLSRVRKDASFPNLSIEAALQHAGISFDELDAVAFGWNRPGITPLHTIQASLRGDLQRSPQYIGYSAMSVGTELWRGNGKRAMVRRWGEGRRPVEHVDHHLSHAWSAYGPSAFDDALVVVMDGRGARQATTLYHGKGDQLHPIRSFRYPNSLGSFYEAFTDLLGFQRSSDEWKVMGLAAYGEPTYDLSDVLRPTADGYQLDARLVNGKTWGDISGLTRRYGPRRTPELGITSDDKNLAASVQKALEDAVRPIIEWGVRTTGSRRLCLAGGVAMNSKMNGNLLAAGVVDDVFVQPAATDDGAAIGAAIAAHRGVGLQVPRQRMENAYLGPEFSDSDIASTISTYKLKATQVGDVEPVVARLLADGKIVGWFQGRMEFGPRALGNRSILADPRRVEMRDKVNEVVKFREGWRPFAPSCTQEAAPTYFEGCNDAPFMILTFAVREAMRAIIPAVTHADQTARVQTVAKEASPRYWRLIDEFGAITGVPVIMNTSFNLKGEPIVCSPKDAIRTFYSSGLDFLVMGNHVIAKDPRWHDDFYPGK